MDLHSPSNKILTNKQKIPLGAGHVKYIMCFTFIKKRNKKEGKKYDENMVGPDTLKHPLIPMLEALKQYSET